MLDKTLNIVITGVGGQGNILASRVVSTAAIRSGLHVRGVETLGAAQRGGHVVSHLRTGAGIYSPHIPTNRADVLIALEPVEGLRVAHLLTQDSLAIVNSKSIPPADVRVGKETYPDVKVILEDYNRLAKVAYVFDATELAIKAGNARAANMVLLGALAATGVLQIPTDTVKEVIAEAVPEGTEGVNLRAFDAGFGTVASLKGRRQSDQDPQPY